MCGLFGIAAVGGAELTADDLARAETALARLAHRGPDASGSCRHGSAFVGHRRLSIIDLSPAGRQPMLSEDGSVAIAVNGEIYNYKAVRSLLGEGEFRSRSDSEVVLHGYRAWGIDRLCDTIDGMYAAVVSDKRRGKLFLFRDRPGVKPLYYGRVGDIVVWASELKAIETFFAGRRQLRPDPTALYDFLTYRYIPSPKSLYCEIAKLPPASIVEINLASGHIDERRYWRAEPGSEASVDPDAAAEELRALLHESVDEQLVSDVPVGFFLSGGIDSSILTGIGAGLRPGCMTFSIGFDVREHDETAFAKLAATRFATAHFTRKVGVDDAGDLFGKMLSWYDEPFADTSALPTAFVSALARERVTVALSGDGADELFGGYSWYRRYWRFLKAQEPWRRLIHRSFTLPYKRYPENLAERARNGLALWSLFDPLQLYLCLMSNLLPYERQAFRRAWDIPADYDDLWFARQYWRPGLGRLKRLQFLDFHTFLADDILTKVDRVSMAVSLETRVPYLSRKLIEFAFRMPESFLLMNGALKGGLKYAYRDLLPPEILARGKKGFGIPAARWRRQGLNQGRSFQEGLVRHILKDNGMKPVLCEGR